MGVGAVLQVFVKEAAGLRNGLFVPGSKVTDKATECGHSSLVCVSCLTKWERDGGWSESYGERKPLAPHLMYI